MPVRQKLSAANRILSELPITQVPQMNSYKVFMQRVQANAGPAANFSFQVQAVNAQMAKITAEAQYPGYRCINSPVRVI